MSHNIDCIKKILLESIDSTKGSTAIFFKTYAGGYAEHDQFIAVRVPILRKIAKKFLSLTCAELSILLESPINEERLLALIILSHKYKISSAELKEEIFKFYTKNLKNINNWNLVDTSAHLIVGAYLWNRDKSYLVKLATSKSLWERRIAIVSTLYFIRKDDLEWTFKIASILQNDSHDLIHKAVGWMLREAGEKDILQLTNFLENYKNTMPRTMLRYAIEKFPKELRKLYLTRVPIIK